LAIRPANPVQAKLRGNNADILDSFIPFFDPILEKLDYTLFNPATFAIRRIFGCLISE